jgi:hypothetical protein
MLLIINYLFHLGAVNQQVIVRYLKVILNDKSNTSVLTFNCLRGLKYYEKS